MDTDRARLRHALLEHGLKLGEGVDRLGKSYEWLIDTREVLLRSGWLEIAGRLLWERLKPYRPEVVGGMTLAANPLTIALLGQAAREGYPLDGALIRREPKADGLCKQVEGPPIRKGARLALLDDLVNMGDTQRQALQALAPFEPRVVAVGVLINYQRAGEAWLGEQGLPLEALFTLEELGMSLQVPSRPDSAEVAWRLASLNSGRYDAPKSAPAVRGDTLYVGSDQGFVLAASLRGEERWRYPVRDRQRGVHATPLLQDGKVIAGAYDGYLYALDQATGRLAWEARPGQWIGSSAAGDPEGGRLYVGVEYGESGGSVVAVEASTGRTIWEARTGGYIHSSPWHDAPRRQVVVGCNDYSLHAFDAERGTPRWSVHTGAEVRSSPSVSPEGTAFATSFDGFLYAVDAASGALRWKRRLGHNLYFQPLCVRDLVVVGSYTSRVVALSRDTGELRWVATTGDKVIGGAAAIGDRLVAVASMDGCLYLLDAESGGTVAAHRAEAGPFMTTPTWTGGLLLVASMGGPLLAYRLRATPPGGASSSGGGASTSDPGAGGPAAPPPG